jgi:ribosome-associated toxin RatA of RatAB toxin-antitoxin module
VRSSLTIQITAPAKVVFELAQDVSRWADLLPHYRRSAVVARRNERVLANFVALRPIGRLGIPVTWRAVCWPDDTDPDDLRLNFAHTRGVTQGMRVRWHIRPLPGDEARTEISIEHEFERPLPLLGADRLPRFVDRFFTGPIATRTLREFGALAETQVAQRDPQPPSPTNQST